MSVSELAFGNFIYGSFMWGKRREDEAEGVRLQNLAFDLGVNFFDTGDAYNNGRAEMMMGETLRYAGREKIVLSTKFGYDFYSDPGTAGSHRERKQDFSEKFITFALEESLKRMGTEYVDLWQAHNLKLPQMNDELVAALEKLRKSGKVRHWGVALGPAIGWREEGVMVLREWGGRDDGGGCVTVQTVFNMLEQHPGRELAEIAAELGQGGAGGLLRGCRTVRGCCRISMTWMRSLRITGSSGIGTGWCMGYRKWRSCGTSRRSTGGRSGSWRSSGC